MAYFSNDDILYSMPSSQHKWIVRQTFYYMSDLVTKGAPYYICVFKGFYTDFASIPRLARIIIDNDSNEIKDPAVIHDWLYFKQPDWCTRKLADKILVEAMKVRGALLWERALVYSAVRIGGWVSWRKYRKYIKSGN